MSKTPERGPEGLSLIDDSNEPHYVVFGDNHGRLRPLEALAELYENRDDIIYISNGDLINKGPQSKECVDMALNMGAVCLVGNCEWTIQRARKERDDEVQGKYVAENYKRYFAKVCESYGVCKPGKEKVSEKDSVKIINDLDQAILAEGHDDYFAGLRLLFESSGLVVVHAGLEPNKSWGRQLEKLKSKERSIDRQDCDWHDMPVQISDKKGHELSKNPHIPKHFNKILITGHHHSDERPKSRITHGGQRVRLGASMKGPLLVYDSVLKEIVEIKL